MYKISTFKNDPEGPSERILITYTNINLPAVMVTNYIRTLPSSNYKRCIQS